MGPLKSKYTATPDKNATQLSIDGPLTDNAKGRDLADLLKITPPQLPKGTRSLALKFGSHNNQPTTFTGIKLVGSQYEDDPTSQIPLIKWEVP